MKRIGLLIILTLLFIGNIWGQNYVFKYNIEITWNPNTSRTFYSENATIHTTNGNTISIPGLNFGVGGGTYEFTGTEIKIPASYGFIDKITTFVKRRHNGDNSCTENITLYTVSRGTSCFDIRGTEFDWTYLNLRMHNQTIKTFECFPDITTKSIYKDKLGIEQTNTFFPKNDLLTINATEGFPSEVYKWEYMTTGVATVDGMNVSPNIWRSVPNKFFKNGVFSATAEDFFGNSVKDMYSKQVLFRINLGCNRNTKILSFTVIPSAPHILSVDSILERCHQTGDAQLILQFDRALLDKENLYLSKKNTISNEYESEWKLEIDPLTFKSKPITGLIADTYELGLIGTYRFGDNLQDTINTYTEGEQHYHTITIPSRPRIFYSISQDSVHCNGGKDGAIKVTAQGGCGEYYAELYRLENGIIVDTIHNQTFTNTTTFTNLKKGTYQVYLQDTNGCFPTTDSLDPIPYQTIEVLEPAKALTILKSYYKEPIGYGYSDGIIWAEINGGTGAYSIIWKDSLGTSLKAETRTLDYTQEYIKVELANVTRGWYSLEVRDTNYDKANPQTEDNCKGCAATMTIYVDEPPKLLVEIQEHHYVTCNGDNDGELVAHAIGGRPDYTRQMPYTYEWHRVTPDSTTILESYTSVNDSILTTLYSGHYVICVRDTNQIEATSRIFHLVQPDPLVVKINVLQNLSCAGENNGALEAIVTGGTPPYSYLWETEDSDTTRVVNGLAKGIYSVFVRDGRYLDSQVHYCSQDAHAEITSPSGMNISAITVDPSCNASSDGAITLTISGGIAPYTYLWEDGNTSPNRSNLPEGEYTIIVTDANKCKLAATYQLNQPNALSVNLGEDFTLCKGRSRIIDGTNAMEELAYLWTKDGAIVSEEAIYSIESAGIYRLTITNDAGCTAYDEIKVSQSDDELTSDFVVASKIPNNTKIYAVNIIRHNYDQVEWIIPDEATVIEKDDDRVRITFPQNGFYTIGLTARKSDCQDILYKTVEVVDKADIEEYDDDEPLLQAFVVYPNPNDGNFTARIILREPINYTLYLFDNYGKLIDTKTMENNVGGDIVFNITNSSSGGYYLRFVSKEINSVIKVVKK